MGLQQLLVATKKGAWSLKSDASRTAWTIEGPMHLGHIVNHWVGDPRDPGTQLMGVKTGHLGPTVFRSTDGGRAWKEASKPPAFKKVEGEGGRAVEAVFWLTPGHASERGTWYAGTIPHGLFRSDDAGDTWREVEGFSRAHERLRAMPGVIGAAPGGEMTHSVLVDPRDAKHLYIGLSGGGFYESVDGGEEWTPLNRGVEITFLPGTDHDYGHDPHCVGIHPLKPDRLWQQNHCGIYRIDRPATRWERVGNAMPRDVGDIGFPIVMHPRDPDTAWVFPMDGTDVWPRTSPGGRPATYRTRDAGVTWERQDSGLPASQGWFTVFRQAMTGDAADPIGLYFGTTGGELWASRDEGASWQRIAEHLPSILAVSIAPEA